MQLVTKTPVATQAQGIWAPLTNVSAAAGVLNRLIQRSANLPGIGVLYGPSGYGKTMAAAYCASPAKYNACYVECRSFTTKRTLISSIERELGLRPARTIAESFDAVCEELRLSGRPLLIDEVDHIAEGTVLHLLRDIHDASHAALMLIGEQWLPRKLAKAERFHNRVLVWEPAQAATLEDARRLAVFYAPDLEIGDDLIKRIHDVTRAVVRRICVNIDMVRDAARKEGVRRIDAAAWGDRAFYTGDAPVRGR